MIMPSIYYTAGIFFVEDNHYPKYDYLHFTIFPLTTILISLAGRPRPMYITGVALAFLITYALYIIIDTVWPRDMAGLDHWLATPGAIIGSIASLVILKRQSNPTQHRALILGLAGVLIGFLATNELFCNTVTYCGPLSILFYTKPM